MDKFILDYDKKTLKLLFNGETFDFDLNDGDVGDFWHSFTPKNSEMLDINFYQEDENDEPSITLYELKIVNGNIEQGDELDVIIACETVGDAKNYFNYVAPTKEVAPKSKKKQVAKLVYMSMVTRVVVDEDATEEQIIEASKSRFLDKISTDLHENIEEVVDDEEMPYNKSYDV